MEFNEQNHCNVRRLDDPIQPIPTSIIPPVRKYRECMKNHTIISTIGEHPYHTVDGCCEFTPGSPDSMKCVGCGCHRCYHRTDDSYPSYPDLRPAPNFISFMPPSRAPAPAQIESGYVHSTLTEPRPLVLPFPESQGDGRKGNLNGGAMLEAPGSASASGAVKRVRTKFTTEQKRMMYDMAERIGWRLNRRSTDGVVQQFCTETGLRRQVFKVWLHNHKKKANSNNGSSDIKINCASASVFSIS